MDERCGCCEGIEILTPLPQANRPGLDSLSYRIGTHAAFLETMKARLSSHVLEFVDEEGRTQRLRPLRRLTTRRSDDPSIALLDAWATLADVLTFYQERIANEGYLRTATERRSILELARLIGYRLRPGVAATVYLAFTVEPGYRLEIPARTRTQSIPLPGEKLETFETSEPLLARAEWSAIRPRLSKPQFFLKDYKGLEGDVLYVQQALTNLKVNDPLLFIFGDEPKQQFLRQIRAVAVEFEHKRTRVTLSPSESRSPAPPAAAIGHGDGERAPGGLPGLVSRLKIKPAVPPASPAHLLRDSAGLLASHSDAAAQLLIGFQPTLKDTLYAAWRRTTVETDAPLQSLQVLPLKAGMFGNTAPPEVKPPNADGEAIKVDWVYKQEPGGWNIIDLDGQYDAIVPDSWVIVVPPKSEPLITKVTKVSTVSRIDYNLQATVTRLELRDNWLGYNPDRLLKDLQGTFIYAQSTRLYPADEPITKSVCRDEIVVEGLLDGLQAGRWLIVSGERADLPGVQAAEQVLLSGVTQATKSAPLSDGSTAALQGERFHSTLHLSPPLKFCYQRETVTIYANVVKATHGETRREVLGSGDGSKALQTFTLKAKPLTHTAAPTPSGAESTLEVFANDVQWRESETLFSLGRRDRRFITKTNDEGDTSIIFGNGEQGARLTTGQENVRAAYRNGIGKPGNVRAGQITLLADRPLGLKEVVNKLRASGGADPEGRDQARRNAPLALYALDRLVSVQDYADFSRTFAGIAKASAACLSNGRQELVYVTITGQDDIPIDETSDLYRNLLAALRRFGDPYLPIRLGVRELMALIVQARVRRHPDYPWEPLQKNIRARLLEVLGFDRRDLGQDVRSAEVLTAIQSVPGVAYIDLDVLDAASEADLLTFLADPAKAKNLLEYLREARSKDPDSPIPQPRSLITVDLARSDKSGELFSAQLAVLRADIPDTLLLQEVPA